MNSSLFIFDALHKEITERLGDKFYTISSVNQLPKGDKFSVIINDAVYATFIRKTELDLDINVVDDIREYPCYQFEIEKDGAIILYNTKGSDAGGLQSKEKLIEKYFQLPATYESDKNRISEELSRTLGMNVPVSMIGYDLRESAYFISDWNNNEDGNEAKRIKDELERIRKQLIDEQCYPIYSILKKTKLVTLVKYTSLETLKAIMEKGTIRIFSIIGMNDKSERNFVNEFLYGSKKIFSDNSDKYQSYYEANRKYVTSLSTKIDNLDMWRWYGKDATEVCLVFQCKVEDVIRNLYPVCYATIDSLLADMKRMISILEREHIYFKFLSMRNWSNFFKHESYKNEKEFRLLINCDKPTGWVIESKKRVLTPYIDLPLRTSLEAPIIKGEFPLVLTNVLLGPNLESKEDNVYQVKLAADELTKIDINVYMSGESTYR